jgi:ATP-dependent Clp protease ATP-binding subunit ClpA
MPLAKRRLKYGHNRIEPEHILLAMLEDNQGIGVSILHHIGIDFTKLKQQIERNMKIGVPVYGGEIPLSPQSKRVLELAVKKRSSICIHMWARNIYAWDYRG